MPYCVIFCSIQRYTDILLINMCASWLCRPNRNFVIFCMAGWSICVRCYCSVRPSVCLSVCLSVSVTLVELLMNYLRRLVALSVTC